MSYGDFIFYMLENQCEYNIYINLNILSMLKISILRIYHTYL